MTSDIKKIYDLIAEIGHRHQVDKITLFGSRARGDNRERSDIDIAVYGLPENKREPFLSDIDGLPTLLEFDVVRIDNETTPELLENIQKDGVTLYERENAKKIS